MLGNMIEKGEINVIKNLKNNILWIKMDLNLYVLHIV